MLKKDSLKRQMIEESFLILESVDWLEERINEKLLEFKRALDDNNQTLAMNLYYECLEFLRQLRVEDKNMENFMVKYQKIINHEKKILLSNSREKK